MSTDDSMYWGLSPRVRGNHCHQPAALEPPRSISARAGEPLATLRWRCQRRVYPRACGGTIKKGEEILVRYGLSPRVRGNLGQRLDGQLGFGSIPARAGEPAPRNPNAALGAVYPRACGGTITRHYGPPSSWGLSPRVRGNRGRDGPNFCCTGSIPARAGEPGLPNLNANTKRVYPRACGGTVR